MASRWQPERIGQKGRRGGQTGEFSHATVKLEGETGQFEERDSQNSHQPVVRGGAVEKVRKLAYVQSAVFPIDIQKGVSDATYRTAERKNSGTVWYLTKDLRGQHRILSKKN